MYTQKKCKFSIGIEGEKLWKKVLYISKILK